ncbi:MAG: hypothetical protein A2W61_03120 [Deltaproteobacteria bacterium RIFCSPLOWO2_01_44_7]|nr:MAG: hypothetical protein A2712_02600 [Deltaproteobacteria bacterium RIFCSPHIGHO2_01_FULL_43_49]OGQ16086.1 MAG: hypothetical protein A3D22_00570 [Deltaproteobacteria bacterium RIFCSPHIGHO2_02_FULL_44_53]OGQ29047.1 MAG: hypothetical protein A3D98_04355 [Deltaproteobacteria bacterium RIFCSPHIGHO2_12_FULL_44_21]OGQ32603.1 MAG: hypothetical protein A2979_08500 [Deltaproteobacteria bacterium RIFCSPLOWO2_01_FULL_45_74]OGQ38345.1 MAG: hypothetical protein A2W61_03120 [Deltaproteobacteria bacterium 
MDFKLRDKIAIVGGSSRGLGKACALQLAKEGVSVVLCARNKENLVKTADSIRNETTSSIFPIQADLSKKEDVENVVDKTLKEFGRIDILINNSGGPPAGTFFDFSERQWTQAYESILLYVVRAIQLVIPHMKKNQWGRIINITSLLVKEPSESLILSSVFRAGVVSLAKCISSDLIKYNITINNICPGAFMTERAMELINGQAIKLQRSAAAIEKENVLKLPLGRYQDPQELGDLVTFLCSEKARGISGTTIPIDGALSRSLL